MILEWHGLDVVLEAAAEKRVLFIIYQVSGRINGWSNYFHTLIKVGLIISCYLLLLFSLIIKKTISINEKLECIFFFFTPGGSFLYSVTFSIPHFYFEDQKCLKLEARSHLVSLL